MPTSIPPTGNTPPASPEEPSKPSSKKDASKNGSAAQHSQAGGRQTLNDLLAQCTPEEKKKFFDLLVQNVSREIAKDQKKMIEQMRKQRENPDDPTNPF